MNVEKLKELKDKGLLTQEEFDRQIANYLNNSEDSGNKKEQNTNTANSDSENFKIKHIFYLAIISMSIYIAVEALFPKSITCKEGVPEKGCECIKQTIAHNVSFPDKIRILMVGASADELSYYVNAVDALRCAFLTDKEDSSNATRQSKKTSGQSAKAEDLRFDNFSNADKNDFDKSSNAYKTKFWYGNSPKDQLLKEKYFNGQLSEDELYSFCESITSCMANMRTCKEVYHSHHGSSDPYVILDANQMSEKQLTGIAMELCGKKVCHSDEEIFKYHQIQSISWFCGSSGCFIGDYSLPRGNIVEVIERIKQRSK